MVGSLVVGELVLGARVIGAASSSQASGVDMRTTGWTAGLDDAEEVEKPLRKRLRLLSEGEAVSQRA